MKDDKDIKRNINISLEKDSSKTIRLELRHPDHVVMDYKIDGQMDAALVGINETEDKHEDTNQNGNEEKVSSHLFVYIFNIYKYDETPTP